MDNREWLDLSDLHFVLLGAASEMGPLPELLRWGANVYAIELPQPRLWEKIVGIARAGRGTLHAPVPKGSSGAIESRAGEDLLTQTPEVRRWLASFQVPMIVSDDVYADGLTFLRLAGANDALITSLA